MMIPKCNYIPAKSSGFPELSKILTALEDYYAQWKKFSCDGDLQKKFYEGARFKVFEGNFKLVNKRYSQKPYDFKNVKDCATKLYSNSSNNSGLNTLAPYFMRAYMPASGLLKELNKLGKKKKLGNYAGVVKFILSDEFKKDYNDLYENFLGAQNEQYAKWGQAESSSLDKKYFEVLEKYCLLGGQICDCVNKSTLSNLIDDLEKIKNGRISKVLLAKDALKSKLKRH